MTLSIRFTDPHCTYVIMLQFNYRSLKYTYHCQLQSGLEYRTFKSRIHSKTEHFKSRFSNAPNHSKTDCFYHSKTELWLAQVVLYLLKKLYLYETTQANAAILVFLQPFWFFCSHFGFLPFENRTFYHLKTKLWLAYVVFIHFLYIKRSRLAIVRFSNARDQNRTTMNIRIPNWFSIRAPTVFSSQDKIIFWGQQIQSSLCQDPIQWFLTTAFGTTSGLSAFLKCSQKGFIDIMLHFFFVGQLHEDAPIEEHPGNLTIFLS